MKILITGFEPFGGETINPAHEAVKLLPNTIKGAEIVKLEIPVVFDRGAKVIEEEIEKVKPDVVVSIGQAGGRSCITIEKVAINLKEARIPDNDGNQPNEMKIREDGENAYFTTLPIKAMIQNMKNNGVPANISYTAGTYVCNDVMYILLYMLEKKYPNIKGGFIHVPFDTAQVIDKPNGTASMPIETIAKGLQCGIEAIIDNYCDININMGTTH